MTNSNQEKENFILFELNKTTYALPSKIIKQMEMIEQITPIPNAPEYIDGIVFSRGVVIPVINLRKRFGFKAVKPTLSTRLIVVQNGENSIGLVADSAREFVTIPNAEIQPPPENISGLSGKYLEGIAMLKNRVVLILDVESMLKITDTNIDIKNLKNNKDGN